MHKNLSFSGLWFVLVVFQAPRFYAFSISSVAPNRVISPTRQLNEGSWYSRGRTMEMKALGTLSGNGWAGTRTADILQAYSEGEMRKRDFTSALASRLGFKFTNMVNVFSSSSKVTSSEAIVAKKASVKDIEAGWQAKGYGSAFARAVGIWYFAVRILWQEFKLRKVKDVEMKSARRRYIATQLREGLVELGPTFIKLGQLLSTRIDVVPKEYIAELVQLQDNVPGFSGARAVSIIEEELGQPIGELYLTFDSKPLAAASLGQVHVATLKDSGMKVAVKVQRQGLKELFDQDLQNLKVLAKLLDKLDPKLDGADRNWVRIYEESAKLLYKEIDYTQEAASAKRFKQNFSNTPWIKVPDIIDELTSQRVLTMEFVPGIKINDIAEIEKRGIDRGVLAKRSAEAFLTQICRHSLFHSDPHPGNLACDEECGGRLIFYDFGMMDELNPMVRAGLVDLIFSIYENDPKLCCDALEQMGILKPGSDRVSIESIARTFLNEFSNTIKPVKQQGAGEAPKWASQLSPEDRKRIRAERRIKLGADLLSVTNDTPFQFPPTFTFVFRAFTSLDGIGKGLDPAYDLTRLAQPYLRELLDLRDGSVALSAVKSFTKAVGWRPEDLKAVVQSPRSIAYVTDVVQRLERGDLKLRVRVLESERASARVEMVQNNIMNAVAFGTFLNASILLWNTGVSAVGSPAWLAIRGCMGLAGLFGLNAASGILKVKKQDKRLRTYGLRN